MLTHIGMSSIVEFTLKDYSNVNSFLENSKLLLNKESKNVKEAEIISPKYSLKCLQFTKGKINFRVLPPFYFSSIF
jgi:hypothetical protein